MFKTPKSFESPQKDTRPKPLGFVIYHGEKHKFYNAFVSEAHIRVSKDTFKMVKTTWYQLEDGKYVPETDCAAMWYQARWIPQE